MLRFATAFIAVVGFTCVPAFGSLTFVTTPGALSSNSSVLWSQFGGDGTPVANNAVANSSTADYTATTTFGTAPRDGEVAVCGASWSPCNTPLTVGDSMLWAFDSSVGTGNGTAPLTFALSIAVNGIGAYVQADTPAGPGTCTTCTYTVLLNVFSGGSSLGTHSYTSDAAGDALFIGAINSPLLANITSVVVSLTSCPACNGGGGDLGDFAVDGLLVNEPLASVIPEPSAYLLFGSGLAAIAWMQNKKNNRRKL
jgi:hypothetical protein